MDDDLPDLVDLPDLLEDVVGVRVLADRRDAVRQEVDRVELDALLLLAGDRDALVGVVVEGLGQGRVGVGLARAVGAAAERPAADAERAQALDEADRRGLLRARRRRQPLLPVIGVGRERDDVEVDVGCQVVDRADQLGLDDLELLVALVAAVLELGLVDDDVVHRGRDVDDVDDPRRGRRDPREGRALAVLDAVELVVLLARLAGLGDLLIGRQPEALDRGQLLPLLLPHLRVRPEVAHRDLEQGLGRVDLVAAGLAHDLDQRLDGGHRPQHRAGVDRRGLDLRGLLLEQLDDLGPELPDVVGLDRVEGGDLDLPGLVEAEGPEHVLEAGRAEALEGPGDVVALEDVELLGVLVPQGPEHGLELGLPGLRQQVEEGRPHLPVLHLRELVDDEGERPRLAEAGHDLLGRLAQDRVAAGEDRDQGLDGLRAVGALEIQDGLDAHRRVLELVEVLDEVVDEVDLLLVRLGQGRRRREGQGGGDEQAGCEGTVSHR
ncbi:MAG: hypothetical protein R3F30_12605 [Planctomycetota bacterium]